MNSIEKAIWESESQKQAILEGSEDVIVLFDQDCRVLWTNNSIVKLSESPIGSKCHEIFCGDDKRCDNCIVRASFQEMTTDPSPRKTIVTGAKNQDLFFTITATPVRNLADRIEKVVVIARDITERLQLERQLRHAAKMEAVGTLAGGIAHDFNNVLTPIMGYSEIIRLNMANHKIDEKELTGYVDEILKAAKRAKRLVEQILTFSRSIDHKESRQYIHPILKEAMKLIHVTLPSSIEIIQDIDENCGTVSVDPVEIHQILIHLCSNAADAMAGMNGVLKVTLKKSASTAEDKDWLELSISDTGSGVAPDLQERIFEPYFTTKEKSQGTGMGLAMVHGIIKRQGGKVTMKSKVGEGTTISLFIPVFHEVTALDKILNIDELAGGDEHILLVDDEQSVVSSTAEMLRNLGYKVTGMTSSREAFLRFFEARDSYDIVVTDLTMPYMSGIELCQRIKEVRPKIPVLLFTGFLEDFSRAAAMQSGVDGFCMKPISMKDMARTIRTLLGRTKKTAGD